MTADRCDCCELPSYLCVTAAVNAVQRAEEAQHRRAIAAQPGVIAAMTASECPECKGWIAEGDLIRHTDWGWAHADPRECSPDQMTIGGA